MNYYEITYIDHAYADSKKEAMKMVWADLDKNLLNRFASVTEVEEESDDR